MVKNPPANAGGIRDMGSIPKSGRSPGGEHGNPLQYSRLENSHGQKSLVGYCPQVAKSRTQLKQLSARARSHTHTHPHMRACACARAGGGILLSHQK